MATERNDDRIDKPFHSAGETVDVLASISLADVELPPGSTPIAGRELRMRRVVVEPGGVIADHPHENRPAILYITAGRLLEFSPDDEQATEHIAPAVVTPTAAHWWRNPGEVTVEIIAADLFDPSADGHGPR